MKHLMRSFSVLLMVGVVLASLPAWGEEKNLDVNKAVTAKIRAFDKGFFKGFDVYTAGVKEAPTALLFDKKDDYPITSRYWGEPLSEEEIVYAIYRLDDQYNDNKNIPFQPRALNVVNLKGAILGYVYTGINSVLMDRKKNGSVTVFPPDLLPRLPMGRNR